MPHKSWFFRQIIFAKRIIEMCYLYFAASEKGDRVSLLESMGVQNVLMSFYYLRKKPNAVDFVKQAKDILGNNSKIMLDSGAYTFMAEDKNTDIANIENYLIDYINFLSQVKNYITVAVNLDLEDKFGVEKVNQWNEQYFEPLVKEALQICFVWHGIRKVTGLHGYAKKYRYVGIPGGEVELISPGKIPLLGREHKTVFHGFGFTRPSQLIRYPFFSADSSSWLAGEEYGVTYLWTGANFLTLDKEQKHRRKRYKNIFIQAGIDFDKLLNDNPVEVNKMNILAWLEVERWINRRTKNRKYWEGFNMPEKESENAVPLPNQEIVTIETKAPPLDVKVRCSNCYLGISCSGYKQGQECSFDFTAKIDSSRDMIEVAKKMIAMQAERVSRAIHIEKADGGAVDKSLSQEMTLYMKMLKDYKDLFDNRDTLEIKAKGTGILTKIFGKSYTP